MKWLSMQLILKERMRLNIFGMIDRNNRYDGFSTTENITVDKVVDFLDRLSFRIKKNTFVVLDTLGYTDASLWQSSEQSGTRIVSFLPASILATSEHSRNPLAHTQR